MISYVTFRKVSIPPSDLIARLKSTVTLASLAAQACRVCGAERPSVTDLRCPELKANLAGRCSCIHRLLSYVRPVKGPRRSHCWIFTGAKRRGYGAFHVRGFRGSAYAHIVAFRLFKAELTPRRVVMHACDVSTCVNPMHLTEGTHRDNQRDRHLRGRTRLVRDRVAVQLQRELLERVDAHAARLGIARTHAVERLLLAALDGAKTKATRGRRTT
jgi:hypothetical protein